MDWWRQKPLKHLRACFCGVSAIAGFHAVTGGLLASKLLLVSMLLHVPFLF
jgi:hypothetical protein